MRRSGLIIGAGGLILLAGAVLTIGPWIETQRWQSSPQAAQAERNAAAPTLLPVRMTPTPIALPRQAAPAVAVPRAIATPVARPPTVPTLQTAAVQPKAPSTPAPPEVQPTPILGPSDLTLDDVAFQFLDPPQPGATALLSLTVHNPTEQPSGPVALELPLTWLNGYSIEGVVPLPVDGTLNGERTDKALRLTVDAPPPGASTTIEVYVVATDEVIDAPNLRLVDAEGRAVGQAQPPTEAPHAAPGPVYSLDLPTLHLHTGVVQVDWEPPLFVVGQVRSSARVTEGNSVLVGHVRGAAGYNVFDHLDKLVLGDPVVANSRGETYDFVVTDIQVLPQEDTSPTLPTESPRLTLMTCSGVFNPLTGEYSDRLWVIAEPADVLAARTTAASQPAPTASTQIAPPGGFGNTDSDLARVFGAPVGESRAKLAVYERGGAEHQVRFVDDGQQRRADVVVERARPGAPMSLEEARRRARTLLPRDAQPRAAGAEGNRQFVVEYFTSAALPRVLPAPPPAAPGDMIVVYRRQADGRVTDILLGAGNDPAALLALLN